MSINSKSDEILDLAEQLARTSGYNGLSLHDLARAANVTSGSIDAYFATKEDLVLALVRRYAARVYEALGDPRDASTPPDAKIATFIDVLRNAYGDDGRVCLLLLFGSELTLLPASVQEEVRTFFDNATDWLATVLRRFDAYGPRSGRDAIAAARTILATMEGAMVMVRMHNDFSVFYTIVEQLKSLGIIPGGLVGASAR